MRITPRWMAVLVVTILFGGILLSNALGEWTTKSTKEPLTFAEGEFAGEYNPADIRGSYTFGDVSELFDIPLEDLAVAFRVSEPDVAAVSVKTLEEKFVDLGVDLGTSSVRLFVALYRGLPFDLTGEDTYLLPEATELLKQKASLSPEQLTYLESHTAKEATALSTPAILEVTQTSEVIVESTPAFTPTGGDGTPGGGSGTPDPEHTPEANKVGGKTTFQNLLDWGVKQEDIEKVIGQPLPAASLLIKDWATSQGLSFSTLKDQLQALVDAVK
jgi:hypothetical protein